MALYDISLPDETSCDKFIFTNFPLTLKIAYFEGKHTLASIFKILLKNMLFNTVMFVPDA